MTQRPRKKKASDRGVSSTTKIQNWMQTLMQEHGGLDQVVVQRGAGDAAAEADVHALQVSTREPPIHGALLRRALVQTGAPRGAFAAISSTEPPNFVLDEVPVEDLLLELLCRHVCHPWLAANGMVGRWARVQDMFFVQPSVGATIGALVPAFDRHLTDHGLVITMNETVAPGDVGFGWSAC